MNCCFQPLDKDDSTSASNLTLLTLLALFESLQFYFKISHTKFK